MMRSTSDGRGAPRGGGRGGRRGGRGGVGGGGGAVPGSPGSPPAIDVAFGADRRNPRPRGMAEPTVRVRAPPGLGRRAPDPPDSFGGPPPNPPPPPRAPTTP